MKKPTHEGRSERKTVNRKGWGTMFHVKTVKVIKKSFPYLEITMVIWNTLSSYHLLTLSFLCKSALHSSNLLTASTCPPSAAEWSGVLSFWGHRGGMILAIVITLAPAFLCDNMSSQTTETTKVDFWASFFCNVCGQTLYANEFNLI